MIAKALGTYQVIEKLGEGGMGEVYLAHDTKLNRRVAIKILPEAYATDPDRIARFHREAQAVAALNHSGIAAIYDLAEAEGTKFLVLELIEGDTLADRLRRGPVPVEDALQIAKQILEALEAAHERGVCHRDLKPANVKLTPDGAVKVLDFGLAKFVQTGSSAPNMTHSPTLSLAGTYPGVILGTAGYMSPEQAKGFEADQRSDIFSFGCILYELLTGRQAFEGDTASDILASVLKSDVDWSALPPRLNPRLIELLKRCLEKNPKKRWHAAADVRVEIEALIGHAVIVEERQVTAVRAPFWKRALWPISLAAIVAALAAYSAWTMKAAPASPITRFAITLPEAQQFTNTGRQVLALSPDGSNLVYVANNRLFLRPMSALDAREIQGTEFSTGVLHPVFSPDGQSIVFRANADNTLKRIALSGGAAVTVCSTEPIFGMSWDESGIVFSVGTKGIMRVSPNGGVPEVIATVANDEIADGPQLLPGGRVVMFSKRKTGETWDRAQIVAQPLDGGARTTIIDGGSEARYLPTGHLLYALGGVVLAVPFDVNTLSVKGGPVPLIEGVRRGANAGSGTAPASAHFAISKTGLLAYVPGPAAIGGSTQTDLALFDRKGGMQPLKLPRGPYTAPRVSRDGRWAAFESADEKSAFIAVYELSGQVSARRLTFEDSRAPIWSPDGQWIAYQANRDGRSSLFRTRADGAGTAEPLTKPEEDIAQAPQSWSPDGSSILFSKQKGGDVTTSTLWLLTLKDGTTVRWGDMTAREATFSPDGRWVAYGTRGPSGNQVFVEPFPRTGAKYLLPIIGGHPFWSPRGDELITNSSPVENHVTAVLASRGFAFGQPAPFARRGRQEPNPLTGRRNVDIMPDGQQVVGVMSQAGLSQGPDAPAFTQIIVVLNWFDELRQRVPLP